MSRIQWQSERLDSHEQCELVEIPGGHRLSGIVLIVVERRPAHIVYQVDVDERWHTRTVRATLFGEQPTALVLTADGEGHWQVDGAPEPALDGCLDIDLAWTPATNTLPIRRLSPRVGSTATIDAAWITFPELEIRRLHQTYERIAEDSWTYSSASFRADLLVDPDGLVLAYGDLWQAVAHSDPNLLG